MNTLKLLLTSTRLIGVSGLALGLSVGPAAAGVDCDDPKFATHKQCSDADPGGAGGDSSGKGTPIEALVIADPTDPTLVPDVAGSSYQDGVGSVKASTGGETQPNKPGIVVDLRGNGRNPRTIRVAITCTNPDVALAGADPVYIGGESGCADFQDAVDNGDREQVFDAQRAEVALAARPYEVNCPGTGECLDVFTLADGETEQMGLQTRFYEQILVEFASAIGGPDAPNPGRCLSVLSEGQRSAYLAAFCNTDLSACNVDVTAVDQDTEGRNNSWDIVAAGDTGLICSMLSGNVFVIGVATNVSFEIQADAL